MPSCFKSNVFYLLFVLDVILVMWGRTHIHYNNRCGQHLRRDKNLFKRLVNNKKCKEMNNTDYFKILGSAKTRYELALQEGRHIKWRKPVLNIQKKHEIMKLLV